jgi:hypothetical protein
LSLLQVDIDDVGGGTSVMLLFFCSWLWFFSCQSLKERGSDDLLKRKPNNAAANAPFSYCTVMGNHAVNMPYEYSIPPPSARDDLPPSLSCCFSQLRRKEKKEKTSLGF